MMKQLIAGGVLGLAAATAVTVSAQNDEPTPQERAVAATETRQAVFKLLGYNMGAISGMAQGDLEFDAELAARNARRIESLAPMIAELFERNDTRDFDVDTRTLDSVWDEMDEFSRLADELQEAAATFAATAEGGDRMQILGGVRAFGSTCGNCHDEYRD